jgi:hypothetical protein
VREVCDVIRPDTADAAAPIAPGICSRTVASTASASQPYAIHATVPTASTAIESRSWLFAAPNVPAVIQRRPRPRPARATSATVPFSPRIIAFIPLSL